MNLNIIVDVLKYFDCFGTTFNFYTEKNRKYYTIVGGIFTLSSIVFGVIIFVYMNLDDFLHNQPNSTKSTKAEKPHLINFREEKIWLPWRIRDYDGKLLNHHNLFYPIIYYYKGSWNHTQKNRNISHEKINYKLCNETSMANNSDHYIIDVELDQLYCIDMEDLDIGGSWDYDFINYIQLDIYSCKDGIDYDQNNENCTVYEDIVEKSGENNSFEFEMYYPVVIHQPTNKTNPIFVEYSNYYYLFSRFSNKIDRIYLQKYISIDDRGWIMKDEHESTYWGYSSLVGDCYANGNKRDFMNEGSTSRFYSVNIYIESDIVYYKRSYKKVYLIIANGLPLVNIIYIFFKFFAKIFKISSGNKKLTELLFENLKEKRTFFHKRIFPSSDKNLQVLKKTDDNDNNNINSGNNNDIINNNSNLLLIHNINDFTSLQDLDQKNNLFGHSQVNNTSNNMHIEKKKPSIARNVKTTINTNIYNNKHFNNIYVLGDHNQLNNRIEDAFDRKSGDKSSSFNGISKQFNNNNNIEHLKIMNIKAKTHYIKKELFPYKYYLCSIFIKNINLSKGTFFFTKKFIIVYNFICQLFDISSYLILQREFQTMKNTVIEEKQRHIIEKGQKINVGANSFSINMKECLDNKKLSIFGKIKQTKDNK